MGATSKLAGVTLELVGVKVFLAASIVKLGGATLELAGVIIELVGAKVKQAA